MLGVAVAARADVPGSLQALVWTDREHAREVLLEQPATCPDPALRSAMVAAGEGLFNSPATLGGQAERAGLSCGGCHTNGRRNPWFRLDGVSAGPGTADVSSSFFSVKRANGKFDPRPIPDLALPGKISRDPATADLERFLRGLIVEEFSGSEPSPTMLSALASYVRAVRACPGRSSESRNLSVDLLLVNAGIDGAEELLRHGDPQGASALISGTRFRLGLISERYFAPGQARLRHQLLEASRDLGQLKLQPGSTALNQWQQHFVRTIVPGLRKQEGKSLYAPERVRAWLDRR